MKTEVTPKTLAIVVGILVVIVGGYFLVSNKGPQVLHGTGGAVTGNIAMPDAANTKVDPFAPQSTTKGD